MADIWMPIFSFDLWALIFSIIALGLSYFSWRTSAEATRASIFDRRFDVYSDAEKFIAIWARDGKPDLDELQMLVGAWNRSQFLFDQNVTNYLRKIWKDAVKANFANKVISGDVEGDREQWMEISMKLFEENVDFDNLRATFYSKLNVNSDLFPFSKK